MAKCLSINERNLRPMFLWTFLLSGGLYESIFCRSLAFRLVVTCESNFSVYRFPFSSRAFWYDADIWPNDALSDDKDDRRLLMVASMFFVMVGG